MEAIIADRIFTGTEWLTDHAIIVEDGVIADVISTKSVENCNKVIYTDCFIAPAFIDLQIYGAKGSLLAVDPSVFTLQKMYEYCLEGGAHFFQPTVATNTYEVIFRCIDAIKQYRQQGGLGVLGLHVEGPWINPKRKGAHVEALIHTPTIDQVNELLNYGKGIITMITIAPEVCSKEVIDLISFYGVVISAGHSDATFDQATNFFDQSIHLATHLYNAMSPLHHRAPGMVGAILNHPSVMSGIVADGYHVDFAAIKIANKIMGERLFLVTDAVTETSEGFYKHHLEGEVYTSEGILSGSALTMAKAVKNCVDKAGIDLEEALRMASLYPAKAAGLENTLGRIEKGFKAAFVALDNDLQVVTQ